MSEKSMFQFKGQRNDIGAKFVPEDYFYNTYNVNQNDIVGFNKALAPSAISTVDPNNAIDGMFQYNYLDSANKLREIDLTICGGKIYIDFSNPTQVYSGLSSGRCQTCVINDKLLISNGIDYPIYYNGFNFWQMGAPEAVVSTGGALIGSYKYAITYVTAGGEEYLGTVSNSVSVVYSKIQLNLSIGYLGTLTRKIYRTSANGTQLKYLATISDNTTLTYIDNNADSTLGTNIISINNECPKPKFITVSETFKLVGVGDVNYPTQAFIGDANLEVWDSATYEDITNRSNDNTPIVGMSEDYGIIVVGSQKQIYFLDVSGASPVVTVTRANMGVLDGYSMVKMPSNSGFAGGIMFVSSDYTVRVLNGNYADPVPTSLDNIKTENWAQEIRGSLSYALNGYSNIDAEYFDYKYHLLVDDKIFVFDTRVLGWHILQFITANNTCIPNILVNFDNEALYIGRKNGGYIEKMYSDVRYKGEDLPASVKFPYWVMSEDLKYFRELHIYYNTSASLNFNLKATIGDKLNNKIDVTLNEVSGNIFDTNFFDPSYFIGTDVTEDYKVLYLNAYGNWIQFEIDIPANTAVVYAFDNNYFDPRYFATPESDIPYQNQYGNMTFIRGIRVIYDEVSNKEIA